MTLHTRPEPDYNGYSAYETFTYNNAWWWSAVNDQDDHVGFRHGPFTTEAEAIADAEEQG